MSLLPRDSKIFGLAKQQRRKNGTHSNKYHNKHFFTRQIRIAIDIDVINAQFTALSACDRLRIYFRFFFSSFFFSLFCSLINMITAHVLSIDRHWRGKCSSSNKLDNIG